MCRIYHVTAAEQKASAGEVRQLESACLGESIAAGDHVSSSAEIAGSAPWNGRKLFSTSVVFQIALSYHIPAFDRSNMRMQIAKFWQKQVGSCIFRVAFSDMKPLIGLQFSDSKWMSLPKPRGRYFVLSS